MKSDNKAQPLILIGMHRSGTSLLAGILEKCGIFMGARKDDNNESVFFQRLNEWLLRQANASWDNPYNFKFVDSHFKEYCKKVLITHLRGLRRIEYLGLKGFLKYRDIRDLDFPWGWKDPRNTFTIELWKDIFPEAKVLHVYRNPVDVAVSLRKREEKLREGFNADIKKWIKERLLKGKTYPHWSVRIQDIYEGINLWREYVEKAFSLDKISGRNIFHIEYEAFLEEPERILREILDFAGINFKPETLSGYIKGIDSTRRFAFINDEELVRVYREIKDMELVRRLGYDRIMK